METTKLLKQADIQVTFIEDPTGKVTGLVVHQNGEERPALKIS